MYIVLDRTPRNKPQTIGFYGTTLTFARCEVDGEIKYAARIPDAAQNLRNIRSAVKQRPHMRMVKDSKVTPLTGARPDLRRAAPGDASTPLDQVAAPSDTSPINTATLLARNLGWDFADLVGTGEDGNSGEKGGRSGRTGLTLAEMAMIAPPPGWEDSWEANWPWQVEGFTSTLPNWTHPNVADKPQPEGEPEAPNPNAPYTLPDGAAVLTENTPDPVVNDPDDGDDGDNDETPPGAGEDDASDPVALGYPEADVEGARAVLAELIAKDNGTPPSRHKANYWLKEAGVETMNDEQLAAFLSPVA